MHRSHYLGDRLQAKPPNPFYDGPAPEFGLGAGRPPGRPLARSPVRSWSFRAHSGDAQECAHGFRYAERAAIWAESHKSGYKEEALNDFFFRVGQRTAHMQAASPRAHEVQRLSWASLPSDTAELARYLIGKTIERKIGQNRLSGRVVETEANAPGDRSGHAYRGRTPRTQTLFQERAFAYV